MSGTERLLEVLADHRPHSSHELYRLGLMVHSRVADLRKRGHIIHCVRNDLDKKTPCWWYRLERPLDGEPVSLRGVPQLAPLSPGSPSSGLLNQHGTEVVLLSGQEVNGNSGPLDSSGLIPSASPFGTTDPGTALVAQPGPSEATISPEQLTLIDARSRPLWA